VSPRGHRPPNAPAARLLLTRARHSLAALVATINTMRGLLLAAAVLVVAVLLDANFYNGHYLNAAGRMIAEISAHLLGG
jgi:hypothetical protein